MFESVEGLFAQREQNVRGDRLQEGEVRYWVERWLRGACKSEAIYCEQVRSGVVHVRVESGVVRGEVVLWGQDLLRALGEDLDIKCERIQFVY